MNKYILLRLANESYGIEIPYVLSIEVLLPITRIPYTSASVLGLANLRGEILPVIDLRRYLGLPSQETTESTRIIVAHSGTIVAGLMVDAATNVVDIADEDIDHSPTLTGNVAKHAVKGIANTNGIVVAIMDVVSILEEHHRVTAS